MALIELFADSDRIVTLGVLVGAMVLFVTEAVSVDVVGLLVIVVLMLGGVLDADTAMMGFSSPALVTIACMFVLSAGLIRAGALDALSSGMERLGAGSRPRMIVALMLSVAVSSAFVNNTPVVVIFLPVVLALASRLDLAPSQLLIPMSYASILGGTCTLIGTSTNLLVSQSAQEHGFEPFGIFEFTGPGVIFALVGFAFLAFFGPRLLPRRASVSTAVSPENAREFVTEIMFPDGSPLVDKSYQEVLGKMPGIAPLMVIRGDEIHLPPLISNPHTQFVRAGDVVLLRGEPGSINAVLEKEGVELPPELGELFAGSERGKAVTMVELVVNPNSPLIGRTLRGAEFQRRFGGAAPIAVLRRDEHIRERVSSIRLRLGDTVLAVVDESRLDDLRNTPNFVLLEGVDQRVVRKDKAPIAVGIMVLVVTFAAAGLLPIAIVALAGVALMIVTDVLPMRIAYRSIDMSIVLLIAGMLALGRALEETGLIHVVADGLVNWLQPLGPRAVIAGIYVLAALLTSVVSNNAVAVLLTPVALDVGQTMGFAPAPFLFAVLFGASACFATPMGYQTNLFVYGPGGYRFTDYLRIGVPLNVVLFITAVLVIPWVWPLAPVG